MAPVTQSSVVTAVATAALSTAWGSVPVGRLTGGKRLAFIGVPAAAAGFAGWRLTKDKPHTTQTAAATAGAAAIAAGQTLNIVIDRTLEQFLVRHQVGRPRLVLGLLNGVIGGVVMLLDPPTYPAVADDADGATPASS